MNKHITFKATILSRIGILIVFLLSCIIAKAEDIAEIEFNKEYKTSENAVYKFSVENNSTLTIHFTGQMPELFADAECTEGVFDFEYSSSQILMAKIVGNVEGGKTYYLKVSPFLDPVTFLLTIEESGAAPKIESLEPAENAVFPITHGGLISITFSKNINYSEAKIVCANASTSIIGVNQNGIYAFDIKEELFDWLDKGVIKGGEAFNFVMENVCDASDPSVLYGTDGTLSISYIAPEKPMVLETAKLPEKFLSYWLPDNEEGVITMTFSKKLKEGAVATLGWGNVEAEGEYYTEIIPATIDGNTLTVDLRGKLRNARTMLPYSYNVYTIMNVDINNILDESGSPCYSSQQGAIGSFDYGLAYEDITTNFAFELTPASGSLSGKSSIEFWTNSPAVLHSYEGVKFTYYVNNEFKDTLIAKDKLDASTADGELIVNIPVIEEIQNAENVNIWFEDVLFVDGLTREIAASYNTVTNVSTPNGVAVNEIGLGTHSTPDNQNQSVFYYYYDVTDDGTLTISATSDVPKVFTDTTFTTRDNDFVFSYANGGQQLVGNVARGERVYIMASPFKPIDFTLKFIGKNVKPALEYLSPEEGSVFSITDDGIIALRFNKNITYTEAKIVCANKEAVVRGTIHNGTYAFNVKSTLYTWMMDGTALPNTEVKFIMTGVYETDNPECVYGSNGTLTISYILPKKPTVLVDSYIPETFLSYWVPGNEEGIVKLTFSDNLLATSGACTLGWGSLEEEGKYYSENVPISIQGNVVTVDLTGKLRSQAVMLPGNQTAYPNMNLFITNLKDTQGNACYSEIAGTVGSYKYSPLYSDISCNIAFEFTPKKDEQLAAVDSVELWIDDYSKIYSYDGVKVEYTYNEENKTTIISNDDLKITSSEGETTIKFALTDEMKKGANVAISLNNPVYLDGNEHNIIIIYTNSSTGIDHILTDNGELNGTFDIYTVNGTLVIKNADKSQLKALPAGIYIAGKTKVVVKRQ